MTDRFSAFSHPFQLTGQLPDSLHDESGTEEKGKR